MDNFEEEEHEWVLNQGLEEEYERSIQAVFHSWMQGPLGQCSNNLSGRSPNIERDRLAGHERIWNDYFSEECVYSDVHFRRRFRMCKILFLRIMEKVSSHAAFFQQQEDATGLAGLTSIQKVTAALRMLAYGSAADQLDEYIRIGESTTLKCLHRFCKAVVELYSVEYLRNPTVQDVERILSFNQARGWPGMMGSIDCMHWDWKNCPRSWAGHFQGKAKHSTIVLEAVASYDLWIWHAFFGMPGSMNDLNILDRSPIFKDQVEGVAPKATFRINGNLYRQTYLLGDGIYPSWATFVKRIAEPEGEKRKHFTKMQEATRKDVERAFGVLQSRWAIIREPARAWHERTLKYIMTACIILHNLIVEDERGVGFLDPDYEHIQVRRGGLVRDTRLPNTEILARALRDEVGHYNLRNDLVEHLWSKKGEL